MVLAFVQAETGFLPLGAADPTARLEGFRDLALDLDARARAEGAPYVLTQGYALTSLMRFYGDPSVAVVQPEQRIRWIFEPSPPESLFAAPGLALAEAGRRYDLILKMRYRSVEPLGALERRRAGLPIEAYELYRVADPYAPVLDPALSERRGRSRAEVPAMNESAFDSQRAPAGARRRRALPSSGRATAPGPRASTRRAVCAGAFPARQAPARR